MKVLIIHAKNNLDVREEINEITNNFDFEIMYNIHPAEVLRKIAKGNFDILHFATHGSKHILATTETEWLTGFLLNEAIREDKLVFANACDSVNLVNDLEKPSLITWAYEVNDKDAAKFATIFYRALSLNPNIKRAIKAASKEFALNSNAELPIAVIREKQKDNTPISINVAGNVKTIIGQQFN